MPFDALFVPAPMREAVSDEGWLRAMLAAERALAVVEAKLGVIAQADADAVVDACAQEYDATELAEDGRRVGNPVEPLVRRLRERAERAHWGATSQDILDTAAALVARDATTMIVDELEAVAATCAELAERHRGTVMAARTLLQQAVPTTFGVKAASWLVGVDHAARRIEAARLPAQLGGAAGTLAALGERGVDVLEAFAAELDLPVPVLPWHTRRLPVAELGSALAIASAFLAKVALDVELLAQNEVAEVSEVSDGGSSTMPNKRNPVAATLVRACALRVEGAASVLTHAVVQEHERAAGAWHAEWSALSDALALTGGAASWARQMLDGLELDVDRMRANVSDDTVAEAERFGVAATKAEDYLGSADAFVSRALDAYRRT